MYCIRVQFIAGEMNLHLAQFIARGRDEFGPYGEKRRIMYLHILREGVKLDNKR